MCVCVCVCVSCSAMLLFFNNLFGTILGGRQVHICGAMQEPHVRHFVGEGPQQTHGDPD